MRIKEIELTNWQGYRGAGKNATNLNFDGANGEKNSIIYGKNSHGKTAFFDAIRFALYGRAHKRVAGLRDDIYRPVVASATIEEPLLNLQAHKSGDYTVGVRLWFEHDGSDYLIDRSWTKKSRVGIPRRNDQMEETFSIRNLDKGNFIQEKRKFIDSILPENIARFFMFDGERLKEYRNLFLEAKGDVELKGLIEAVLKLPVLADGITDFEKMLKKLKKEVSDHAKKHNTGVKAAEDLAEEEDELTLQNEILDDQEQKLTAYREEYGVVTEWLKGRDDGKAALKQQELYDEQKNDADAEIEKIKERMSKLLPGTWRAIISNKITSRLENVNQDIERQRKETEEIGVITHRLEHLDSKLKGKSCATCDTPLEVPTDDERDAILSDIVVMEDRRNKLEKTRIDPNPLYLLKRVNALNQMKTDVKLDRMIELEKDLGMWRSKRRTAKQNYDKATKLISNEAKKEIQEKIHEKESLLGKIGKQDGRIEDKKIEVQDINNRIQKLIDKLGSERGSVKKSKAYQKAELKQKIVESFKHEWESVTEAHREEQRENVESRATEVFMSLSNKSDVYDGLRISEDFLIEIVGDEGSGDAGSQAQWALVAYSILDALGACSGLEFPMIIDTPGQSLDEDHKDELFDYLFFRTDRQIFLIPMDSELPPETGDDKYGHTCAATYELKLNKDDKRESEAEIRINNLR